MRSATNPKPSYAELEAEVVQMRELLTVLEAQRSFDRFHHFDAIKDDSCPACGGRVVVDDAERIENGRRIAPGTRLKAVPW